ncbi:MAG: endonuclease/exonuclease/phosphatase family protein [Asticcacaulis sp.]
MRRVFSLACFTASLLWLVVAGICLLNLPQAKAYLIDIFSAPLLVAAVICLAFLALMKQRLSALVTLIAVAGLTLSLWGQMFPARPAPDLSAKPVRLIFANLWIKNQTPEKLVDWVESEQPDIVALVEVGPLAEARLVEALKTSLPHVARRHQTTVLSRFPILSTSFSHTGYSMVLTKLDTPSGPLDLAVAHLTRPWPFTSPDDQPQQVRSLINDFSSPASARTVLVGDFNTTPSAAALSSFVDQTGFSHAAVTDGTWPAALPAPLRLGIDNAFAGQGLSLQNRRTGPTYGSDHKPIRIDIYPFASE